MKTKRKKDKGSDSQQGKVTDIRHFIEAKGAAKAALQVRQELKAGEVDSNQRTPCQNWLQGRKLELENREVERG